MQQSKVGRLTCLCGVVLTLGLGVGGCQTTQTPGVRTASGTATAVQTSVERTSVLFLTKSDLTELMDNGVQKVTLGASETTVNFPLGLNDKGQPSDGKAALAGFRDRVTFERAVDDQNRSALLGVAAVWLVEQVIDFVVKEIKKQAEKYSAEYVVSGSSLLKAKDGSQVNFEAIVVRRDKFQRTSENAPWVFEQNQFMVVYRLGEIPRSKWTTHLGLYDVTPILLSMTDPIAYVSTVGGGKFSSTLRLYIDAAHSGGSVQGARNIVDYSFAAKKLQLGSVLTKPEDIGTRSSAFAITQAANTPIAATVRLSVVEVDGGYDKKLLEAIGGALDNNKTQIVDIVKGATEGD